MLMEICNCIVSISLLPIKLFKCLPENISLICFNLFVLLGKSRDFKAFICFSPCYSLEFTCFSNNSQVANRYV